MNKLIVSNFPEGTTEDDLAQLFRDYAVASVIIKPGKYAVVAFETSWEADKALKEWAGWVWGGQWLRLKAADW